MESPSTFNNSKPEAKKKLYTDRVHPVGKGKG